MFLGDDDFVDQDKDNKKNQQQQQQKQQSVQQKSTKSQVQKQGSIFQDDEVEDLDTYSGNNKGASQSSLGNSANQKSYGDRNGGENNGADRQKTLQDKMKLQQEKYKSRVGQLGQTGQVSQNQNKTLTSNYDDIDYSKLKVLNPSNNQMYEPGQSYGAQDDLPVLKPSENMFKVQEIQNQDNLKLINSDSDSEQQKQKQQPTTQQANINDELKENIEMEKFSEDSGSESDKDVPIPPQHLEEESKEEEEENEVNAIQQDTEKKSDENNSDDENEKEDANKEPIAKPVTNLEIPNMKEFLTKPLPKGLLLQCTIRRDKSGMGRFFPKYHVYLSHGFKLIMSAKKRGGNKTSNYLMGMDKDKLDKKSPGFLGKVRSNFVGTAFHIYDTGLNPKEIKAKNYDNVRRELGCVIYESNLLSSKGPRKMRVLVPSINPETGDQVEWRPIQENDSMISNFKNGKTEGMSFLVNKPPKWNEHIQAFVLNFGGRVDKPSVKNFQLVSSEDDSIIYLQFGRVGDDVFNMDLQWPMTPLQAFGICLSSFDFKIAIE